MTITTTISMTMRMTSPVNELVSPDRVDVDIPQPVGVAPSRKSPESTTSEEQTAMYFSGGRKPAPRSVRIVSM